MPREAPGPRPNIYQATNLLRPVDVRSLALSGILLLLLLYALRIASSFFVPVVLAFLLNFLFSPLVRILRRFHLPEPAGAAIILFVFFGMVAYGSYQLAVPASSWIAKLPAGLRQLEHKLQNVKQSVREVSKASQEVDRITSIDVGGRTQKVEFKRSGVGELLLDQTQDFLAGATIMFVLLFFLLASGDHFLRKLITALPRLQDKKRAVEISRRIEHDVSAYLLAVTLINIIFGTAVGLALFFLGMPNPVLWGVMAGFLHFVPFLGAMVGLGIVTLVALLTLEQTTTIALVPMVYLGLNLMEEYILLPFVISRRLMLNPVIVFLWLTFWGWLWGIPGALMAVPLLAIFKIVCERVQSLSLAAEFLGRY